MNIVSWLKTHKLNSLLIVVILYLLFKPSPFTSYNTLQTRTDMYSPASSGISLDKSLPGSTIRGIGGTEQYSYSEPAANTKEAMVVQNSYLSLVVKDVRTASDSIIAYTKQIGGFMVNTSLSSPGQSPSGSITIRVPSQDLNTTLKYFRDLSVKVVYENLDGEDVTESYTDYQAKLATLEKTKAKFDEIMTKAAKVEDILTVQRELINIQSQIDSVKGQMQYLEKTTSFAKITIYLSTDEFSLPYAPEGAWRPEVIFKEAVRAVVQTFRDIGTKLIWVGVFGIFWIPALIIILLTRKKIAKK